MQFTTIEKSDGMIVDLDVKNNEIEYNRKNYKNIHDSNTTPKNQMMKT